MISYCVVAVLSAALATAFTASAMAARHREDHRVTGQALADLIELAAAAAAPARRRTVRARGHLIARRCGRLLPEASRAGQLTHAAGYREPLVALDEAGSHVDEVNAALRLRTGRA